MLVQLIEEPQSGQFYIWNEAIEQFDEWLDITDELFEVRGKLAAVLTPSEIRALLLIQPCLSRLLQNEKMVPLLPVFTVNQALITNFAFMINSWCGNVLAEQVSDEELNCLSEINEKLTKLLTVDGYLV